MGPVRELTLNVAMNGAAGGGERRGTGSRGGGGGGVGVRGGGVRPIHFGDFEKALKKVKKSVAVETLRVYEEWNAEYGDTE